MNILWLKTGLKRHLSSTSCSFFVKVIFVKISGTTNFLLPLTLNIFILLKSCYIELKFKSDSVQANSEQNLQNLLS